MGQFVRGHVCWAENQEHHPGINSKEHGSLSFVETLGKMESFPWVKCQATIYRYSHKHVSKIKMCGKLFTILYQLLLNIKVRLNFILCHFSLLFEKLSDFLVHNSSKSQFAPPQFLFFSLKHIRFSEGEYTWRNKCFRFLLFITDQWQLYFYFL